MFLSMLIHGCVASSAITFTDPPPAEQLKGILKDYQDQVDAFWKAFDEIKNAKERDQYQRKNYPDPPVVFPRLLALAEKHPKDSAATDALIWVVERSTLGSDEHGKAFVLFQRDHLGSNKLPAVFHRADDAFLQIVLEKSPYRIVQGQACFALAENRIRALREVRRFRRENPEWRKRMWLKGTPHAFLVTTDEEQVMKEIERWLERTCREFADVPSEGRRTKETLGTLADGHLHEIRDLAIGKPAPDMKGVDLEGKPVRLSDLKGRVVVLDVWATWCGPCKAMIPHQRELVKRLKDKPFTLVSISVDEKRETLVDFLKTESMPWIHWYNGLSGGVVSDLNARVFPTIYVVDSRGVIRNKEVRGKHLDQAVDALLKEMER
jgi:thiol-disulfide isomerase/thioredoxin